MLLERLCRGEPPGKASRCQRGDLDGSVIVGISSCVVRDELEKSDRHVRRAGGRSSNQYGAAVYDQHLASAVALPHEIEVGLGDFLGVSDMADRQPRCGVAVEGVAVCLCHVWPERRSHNTGRDDVDANGSELDCERASQSLHGGSDACTERPARMRTLPGNARGEDDVRRSGAVMSL